jgi:hypothetical protein
VMCGMSASLGTLTFWRIIQGRLPATVQYENDAPILASH